ncbi:MAG: PCRF domain-containing protein [Candidatus Pacebacteria bacterium]|nr:PCRF domain-containing protein [Candidatus Paceibacterota bacterium]
MENKDIKNNFNVIDYLENQKTKFLVEEYQRLEEVEKETRELAQDEEMADLVNDDLKSLEKQKKEMQNQILEIIEKEKEEEKFPNELVLEVRAGAGGDEASLFAFQLAEMYQRYADKKGWTYRKLSESLNELGGYKEASFEFKGLDCYRKLRFETGAHRVQRIPTTEKMGRIHTSTATVAIMPIRKKITIQVKSDEIERETSKCGGAGGQSVNKTESAVRLIHIPTGESVRCTEERTQLKNHNKAMSLLLSRLQQLHDEEEEKKHADIRKNQVGTGDRSEKIRTYNFPQDRVTDHRLKKNWHNIEKIMMGEIDDIVGAFEE